MKKFIAIIAAIAMIATMSVSAFAANGTLNDVEADKMSATQAVAATYVDTGAEKVHEIHLDIEWTDMAITYTASDKIWDEDACAWVDSEGSWNNDVAVVKVTTRSSKAVKVTAEYENTGVAASFDVTSATLVAADAAEGAKTATFTLTPSGAITADDDTAGNITITVAAA